MNNLFLVLNLAAGLALLIIGLMIVVFDRAGLKQLKRVKLIVLTALFVGLSLILNRFVPLRFGILQLRFGDFFLILIGFVAGGAFGFCGGIAADFLGSLINLQGTFMLYFTLTSCLWAILPVYGVKLGQIISFKLTGKSWPWQTLVVLMVFITNLLVLGLNPIVLKFYYGIGNWWVLYLPRVVELPLLTVAYSFFSLMILSTLRLQSFPSWIGNFNSQKSINKVKFVNSNLPIN